MVFSDEYVEMILRGEKTVTSRRYKHPRKVGRVYRTKKTWFGTVIFGSYREGV